MTFRGTLDDGLRAVRVNARNEVIVFAYQHSAVIAGGIAATVAAPVNHAPEGRRIPPRSSSILTDKGVPSTSLIPKTGIPDSTPVSQVRMAVLPPSEVRFQPNSPTTRDTNLLWGIMIPTSLIDNEDPATPADVKYATTLAHELGHVLGLGHRGVPT